MTDNGKQTVFILLAISIIGTIMIASNLKSVGIGISPDSITYITAARNLKNGEGLKRLSTDGELIPLKHFPPFYSMILAFIGLTGISFITGALYISVLFYGACAFMAGLIIKRYTRSLPAAVSGALILIFSHTMIETGSLALTEPIFLFLIISAIYYLLIYLDDYNKKSLITSSAALSLAFLTRYAAAPFIACAVIAILLLSYERTGKKITDSAYLLSISTLPIILWFLRNRLLSGSSTTAVIEFHLVSARHLKNMFNVVIRWFPWELTVRYFKNHVYIIVLTVTSLIVTAGVILLNKRLKKSEASEIPQLERPLKLFIGSIVIYFAFLILSLTFFYAEITLNNRMLSPAFVISVISLVCILHGLFQRIKEKKPITALLIFLCVIVLGLHFFAGVKLLGYINRNGINNFGDGWRINAVINDASKVPPHIDIYSNAYDLIYLYTGRKAIMLPEQFDTKTNNKKADYFSKMETLKERVLRKEAVLIYMHDGPRWRWYLPKEKSLDLTLPYSLKHERDYGSFYSLKEKP